MSNASDKKRRYTYEAQPYVCRWNLARLAEALGAELQSAKAGAILDEFMTIYQDFYMDNMRKKLGLLRQKEPEDVELVADLLKTMHITGTVKGRKYFYICIEYKWKVYSDCSKTNYLSSIFIYHCSITRCRLHKHISSAECRVLSCR